MAASTTTRQTERFPHLWLATDNGRTLAQMDHIAPLDAPEALMVVEFEGLTEAEQRAALAAFPGGKRFALAAAAH